MRARVCERARGCHEFTRAPPPTQPDDANSRSCGVAGFGSSGQLGQGTNSSIGDAVGTMGDNLPPIDLGTGRTAVAVSLGGTHTCAGIYGCAERTPMLREPPILPPKLLGSFLTFERGIQRLTLFSCLCCRVWCTVHTCRRCGQVFDLLG